MIYNAYDSTKYLLDLYEQYMPDALASGGFNKEVEAKIPTLLKEQGFEISQFNKITQETKKIEEKNKNIFNTFFGKKNSLTERIRRPLSR